MTFRFQSSTTVSIDCNFQGMLEGIIDGIEAKMPKTYETRVLNEPNVRTEENALHTVASFAVRSPKIAERLYVAMTSPTKTSRKRTMSEDTTVVFAVVVYDYDV